MRQRSKTLVIASLALLTVACAQHQADSSAKLPPPGSAVATSEHGVGCTSFAFPKKIGPASYKVADIGQSDVAKLTDSQAAMLTRIQHYVHSNTLRFAFIENGRFIVFDAKNGPCIAVGGYPILNAVNDVYEPGDNPFTTHGASATNPATPGPWMTSQQ